MRLLTYNLWHGMAPQGSWRFRALEPKLRLQKREERQLEVVRITEADVILLQEANPLHRRQAEWEKNLGMAGFAQPDLAGFKWQGRGWPWNLSSGLLTLVRKEWAPRLVGSVKLSGSPWSFLSNHVGWQWQESRYALFVELLHPAFGRVLVINCHLHHGLEVDEGLRRRLLGLTQAGALTGSASGELRTRLDVANRRREREASHLLKSVGALKNRYSLILLGGDLNFETDSEVHGLIREFGFRDLWLECHGDARGAFTFDGERNSANHVFQRRSPLSLSVEDLSFSPKSRQQVLEVLRSHEDRRRRIDYVFALGGETQVKRAELVGVPSGDELAPSDHFGVFVEI